MEETLGSSSFLYIIPSGLAYVLYFWFLFFFFFLKTGSNFAAQAGLESETLLHQPPMQWHYRCELPSLAFQALLTTVLTRADIKTITPLLWTSLLGSRQELAPQDPPPSDLLWISQVFEIVSCRIFISCFRCFSESEMFFLSPSTVHEDVYRL